MTRRLLLLLILCFMCGYVSAQGIEVPIKGTVTLPDLPTYDDTELRDRIIALEALEARIKALEEWASKYPSEPTDPEEPEEPPVDPDPPVDPEEPTEPDPPIEPDPEAKPNAFFDGLVARDDAIAALSYRTQAVIDEHTEALQNRHEGVNDQIRYDAEQDAAKILIRGSMAITNRSYLRWNRKDTGHLVVIWDYKPAQDWMSNNSTVHTHKGHMLGVMGVGGDRRKLEQRYHYRYDNSSWLVDTRPYMPTQRGGLDRIAPWNETFVPVGKWTRYFAEVRMPGDGTTLYWLRCKSEGGEVKTIYDGNVLSHVAGFDYFDPTWLNTSQGTNTDILTHGWLRNAVVLWNETGDVELDSILEKAVE